jgi:streptogramin lyase
MLGLLPAPTIGQTNGPVYTFTTLTNRASIGSDDGTGSAARFSSPQGVAVDSAGNLFVADTGNHTIRRITPARVVTTIAGSAGQPGSADGAGATARFDRPNDVVVDGGENLYVADTGNHTIRRISPSGVVTTLAGDPRHTGFADGTGSAALFSKPAALACFPAW